MDVYESSIKYSTFLAQCLTCSWYLREMAASIATGKETEDQKDSSVGLRYQLRNVELVRTLPVVSVLWGGEGKGEEEMCFYYGQD